MRSWPSPTVPKLPGHGTRPQIFDSSSRHLVDPVSGDEATLYVCGITPYDATHIGHAATYLAFDTLRRVWADSGVSVRASQNVTDVDDPLLERARDTGVDWLDLARQQTDLFRDDMTALGIIPPETFTAVSDSIVTIASAAARLEAAGVAYRVPTSDARDDDLYLSVDAATNSAWSLGSTSGLEEHTMLSLAAQRGGDPDRPGKRNPLDPLLWRAARDGEPSWQVPVGRGRPGWHVECAVIAEQSLGLPVTVQGGGSDLIFPHHELSAAHASSLVPSRFATAFVHAGMVSLGGEKMSKSLGNLVFVSVLRRDGVDPRIIRLALLESHYRSDHAWSPGRLERAAERLELWRSAFAPTTFGAAPTGAEQSRSERGIPDTAASDTAAPDADADADADAASFRVLAAVREALADDLDTPRALAILDEAAANRLARGASSDRLDSSDVIDDVAPTAEGDARSAARTSAGLLADICKSLLGIAVDSEHPVHDSAD